ncbi:DHH family phosphoesterase [Patescibacteria group bacterium]
MEIKNLKKAADRILKAVKNKERIILYADADMDGITSVIVVRDALKNLGSKVEVVYFPDREEEGYGLNEKALEFLKEKAPALLIILDCGIGNFKEVEIVNNMGFEVIIVDHHVAFEELPKASIIVDPKQKGDEYPFKEFAAAGLAFKLAEALLGEKMSKSLRNDFLELVALATIADMMPDIEDNKVFIEEGLSSLESTYRPGLKVFSESSQKFSSTRELAQKIVSTLNISIPHNHLNRSFELLTCSSIPEAKVLMDELSEKAEEKRNRTKEIVQEVEERISKKEDPIIFEGDSFWPIILAGTTASKICYSFGKPTFIFKKGEKESQGAVRMPKGLNGVEALMSCKDLMIAFGGHPPAAGFRIKNENLEKLNTCLITYFKDKL